MMGKAARLVQRVYVRALFAGKRGLEIGGPSPFFRAGGYLPIYPYVRGLDGVNFAETTVWTEKIDQRRGYIVDGKRMGDQYIMDATDLRGLPPGSYDFLLSCNNLEHIANPLRAVEQWIQVLKPGGLLLIVVPRKESNFDHRRATVRFDHLMEDYRNHVAEDDLTHLQEILNLHDLAMDPQAGTPEDFRERSLNNFKHRCLHHHVFDMDVLRGILVYFGMKAKRTVPVRTDYIALGKRQRAAFPATDPASFVEKPWNTAI